MFGQIVYGQYVYGLGNDVPSPGLLETSCTVELNVVAESARNIIAFRTTVSRVNLSVVDSISGNLYNTGTLDRILVSDSLVSSVTRTTETESLVNTEAEVFRKLVITSCENTVNLVPESLGFRHRNFSSVTELNLVGDDSARIDPGRTSLDIIRIESLASIVMVTRRFVLRCLGSRLDLPQPLLNNRVRNNDPLNVLTSLSGKKYTYLKRSLEKVELYDFDLDSNLGIRFENFYRTFCYRNDIVLEWRGIQMIGKMTSIPTISSISRYRVNLSLQFEGIEIHGHRDKCQF